MPLAVRVATHSNAVMFFPINGKVANIIFSDY